jgi:hypothetical protein
VVKCPLSMASEPMFKRSFEAVSEVLLSVELEVSLFGVGVAVVFFAHEDTITALAITNPLRTKLNLFFFMLFF